MIQASPQIAGHHQDAKERNEPTSEQDCEGEQPRATMLASGAQMAIALRPSWPAVVILLGLMASLAWSVFLSLMTLRLFELI
jgi:hypothetical protein